MPMNKIEMKYSATIDARGRVLLRREIRLRLGVRAGDDVDFVVANEGIFLQAAISEDPFDRYRGILGKFPGGSGGMKAWFRDLHGG
jgi:bifunctional DNA-binding transcriptional regulator/antitoxin component of YhaV-PrlF toxin-antitoxin module